MVNTIALQNIQVDSNVVEVVKHGDNSQVAEEEAEIQQMEQGRLSHSPQVPTMHEMLQAILGEVRGTRATMERLEGRMDTMKSRMTSVEKMMHSL